MSQLVGLNVTTVAFVHRGANRKKFFLTKSTDAEISKEVKGEQMHKVIKTALQTLMKSDEHKESSTDQLLEALKADEVIKKLELSEEDFGEVKEDIEFFKSLTPEAAADPKKKADPKDDPKKKAASNGNSNDNGDDPSKDQIIADLQKSVTTLLDTVDEERKIRRTNDIRKHLIEKAPYAPVDPVKEAELIFSLEKTNPDAAKHQLEQYERTSVLLERSGALDEIGSALPGSNALLPNQELTAEITKGREDLQKSDKGLTPQGEIDMISQIVKGKGKGFYDQYMANHRQLARSGGLNLRAVD